MQRLAYWKKQFVILCAVGLIWPLNVSESQALTPVRSAGSVGLGLGAGTVANGLSLKYYFGAAGSLQMNVGAWGGGGSKGRFKSFKGGAVSVDYLYEMPVIVRSRNVFVLAWNMGLGLGAGSAGFGDDDAGLAAAFVAGLEFLFVKVPIDLVIEFRPAILVVPEVGFDLVDFTAQVRYYF